MKDYTEVFVGIDTSKLRNAIAIAEQGRQGEIRYLGEIDNTPEATRKLVAKLAQRYQKLHFCYEVACPFANSRLSRGRVIPCGVWFWSPSAFDGIKSGL